MQIRSCQGSVRKRNGIRVGAKRPTKAVTCAKPGPWVGPLPLTGTLARVPGEDSLVKPLADWLLFLAVAPMIVIITHRIGAE